MKKWTNGYIYESNSSFYIFAKKHYCPNCKEKLKKVKASAEFRGDSPEAEKYNYYNRYGKNVKVRLTWLELECPVCGCHMNEEEMKKAEGIWEEPPPPLTKKERKRQNFLEFLVFFLLATIAVILIGYLKSR
ncbi:MAG: hypothetical protein IJ043_06205 [Clostridia bacterium]|nr:hypothetical protein [Clostridia bacterium]